MQGSTSEQNWQERCGNSDSLGTLDTRASSTLAKERYARLVLAEINLILRQARSLLLFLTEKLPRCKEESSRGTEDFLTLIKRKVGKSIIRDLEMNEIRLTETECEPFCGCMACYPTGQVIFPPPTLLLLCARDKTPREPVMQNYTSFIIPFYQVVGWSMGRETRHACLPSSVIDSHAQLKTQLVGCGSSLLTDNQITGAAGQVAEAETEKQEERAHSVTDLSQIIGKEYVEQEKVTQMKMGKISSPEIIPAEDKQAEFEVKSALKIHKADIETRVISLKNSLRKEKEDFVNIVRKREGSTEKKSLAILRLEESRAGLERHKKLLGLLPEGDQNLARLLGIVEKSRARAAGLQQQWVEHQEGLEEENNKLLKGVTAAEAIAAKLGKGNDYGLREQLVQVEEKLKAAGAEHKRLVRLVEMTKEGEPREAYTLRIMAILKQLKKLQEGVDAVIADVKVVQKDINILNGRLERSFFEISMTMKGRINNKEPHVEHSMGLLR